MTTLDRATFLRRGAGLLVVGFATGSVPAFAQTSSGAREANPLGTRGKPDVDAWLTVDRDGAVTVLFGKVELGTGVDTAMAQLVADELSVAFEAVHVAAADTALTPDQGYTAGSQTLTSGATPVRAACAVAREALVDLAATRLGVPRERLAVHDGSVFVAADPSRRIGYGALLDGHRFGRTIPPHPPLRSPSSYRIVGTPVPRVDLPGKVTGSYRYVHNVRLPGMRHGRVVLPPRLGATLEHVDQTSLRGLAGVQVVQRKNFLAVVARDEWTAIRAAQALRAQWSGGKTLPAQADLAAAVVATPGKERVLIDTGDADGALQSAAHALHARYTWPFQSHVSIGPSCAVADVRDGAATIWSGTQGVFPLRGAIAQLLGLPATKVRVRYVEASGCYGHNGADDVAASAALLSQAVGAPVRLQYMRADETGWDPKGPAMVVDLRGALNASGTIAAWDYRVWTPTHSGRPDGLAGNVLPGQLMGESAPPTYIGGDRNAPNDYAIPAQRVTIVDQPTALLRQSALRGLGGPGNTFANESFIDELAHQAGADPFAFRLAHLTDPRARAVVEALRADWKPGRGFAFCHYENTQALVAAIADVDVDRASGAVRVRHLWIAHDCGLVVNPDGLRNQIEGNAVQGTSRALKEAVRFDRHAVTSVDWESYPILRFSEVPAVTVRVVDRPNEKILGAGEATTTVIAPAVANAIFARTGARLRSVPFTPEAVKAALRA
ncbi:MAG TPA: molybdopterin cofactor-binding domain-containing protein [Candidatus Sulfotelmatobacter sp.]|nr:molybdopterin cofactor-binding domain-containing protein [Candidatus Sulfotelmatobacter sp.]